MGKGHRDNHAARMRRGDAAFAKKVERRQHKSKCNLCGRPCRRKRLHAGLCPVCLPSQD